jgi:hypothetical protein
MTQSKHSGWSKGWSFNYFILKLTILQIEFIFISINSTSIVWLANKQLGHYQLILRIEQCQLKAASSVVDVAESRAKLYLQSQSIYCQFSSAQIRLLDTSIKTKQATQKPIQILADCPIPSRKSQQDVPYPANPHYCWPSIEKHNIVDYNAVVSSFKVLAFTSVILIQPSSFF